MRPEASKHAVHQHYAHVEHWRGLNAGSTNHPDTPHPINQPFDIIHAIHDFPPKRTTTHEMHHHVTTPGYQFCTHGTTLPLDICIICDFRQGTF